MATDRVLFSNIRRDLARDRHENHHDQRGLAGFIAPFTHVGTLSVLTYRFGSWALTLRFPPARLVCLILYYPVKFTLNLIAGVNIPTRAKIGPGLVIHTWNGVYVPKCQIGRNAFFQHGVVVAYNCRRIGDDVYFGPGAKVIRNITIGNRARIGANAVVIADVPDDCTVAGVPARIVSICGKKLPPGESGC